METKCKCGNQSTRKFGIDQEGFILCCDKDECADRIYQELHELNEREKYYQGKSPRSYESSAKLIMFSLIAISVILIGFVTFKIVNNFLK
jgi:hypothetical protein